MVESLFRPFNVQENVPLAPLTTWRVGGVARFFYEPIANEYQEVISRARKAKIPVYFLGRGSNVLIDDNGINGLVICTRRSLQNLQRDGDVIVAEAGVPLPALSKFAAKLGFSGYEFLIGIPGTVGAGVVINAGLTSQGVKELGERLVSVDVIDEFGNLVTLATEQLAMGYRTSSLLDQGLFVVRARFRLDQRASPEHMRATMVEHLAERRRKQPLSKWTAGSTFKQPNGGHPAGWYIDRVGLKGYGVGGAIVSEKHGNWIVNGGSATARDIRELIRQMQARVAEMFDVSLEREIRYLPEDQDTVKGRVSLA